MPPPLPFKDPKPKPASSALVTTKKDWETRLNREKAEEEARIAAKEKAEENARDLREWSAAVCFWVALIAILFLPLAPIESDVTSIPGHNWIMDQGSEIRGGETDEISDQSQFRSGLFGCFWIGLFGLLIGGLICLGSPHVGGVVMVAFFFAGIVMWLWGTLALGFFEILAGNPYWIADLAILIGSFIVLISPQDDGRQCNAKTRSNRQCTNNKSQGSDYCGVHRCKMVLPIGRCPDNKEKGSNYCRQIDHQ